MNYKSLQIGMLTILLASNVNAASVTTSPKSTATLVSTCQISINDIILGNIIPGAVRSEASTSLDITCSRGVAYNSYVIYSQYGKDCGYLLGTTYGDKFYYGVKSPTSWQGNTTAMPGTGTGSVVSTILTAVVQPAVAEGGAYGTCKSQPKNPGYNPFVTPDNYMDTLTIKVNF